VFQVPGNASVSLVDSGLTARLRLDSVALGCDGMGHAFARHNHGARLLQKLIVSILHLVRLE